jgi:hypothetical protein
MVPYHVPKSPQSPRPHVAFHNKLFLWREVGRSPKPQAGGPALCFLILLFHTIMKSVHLNSSQIIIISCAVEKCKTIRCPPVPNLNCTLHIISMVISLNLAY